jgi:hypothetical protein
MCSGRRRCGDVALWRMPSWPSDTERGACAGRAMAARAILRSGGEPGLRGGAGPRRRLHRDRLPVAWTVETAREAETNFALPLIDKAREHGFAVNVAIMDKGYDNAPIDDGCWTVASARSRQLYRSRGAVAREFGRLKNDWALAPLRVRGLDRVRLHADLTSLAKLACTLRARAPYRSPRRSHPSAGTHVPWDVTTMPSGTRTSGVLGFQLALDLAGTYLFAAASLSPAREPGRFALLLCAHAQPRSRET